MEIKTAMTWCGPGWYSPHLDLDNEGNIYIGWEFEGPSSLPKDRVPKECSLVFNRPPWVKENDGKIFFIKDLIPPELQEGE